MTLWQKASKRGEKLRPSPQSHVKPSLQMMQNTAYWCNGPSGTKWGRYCCWCCWCSFGFWKALGQLGRSPTCHVTLTCEKLWALWIEWPMMCRRPTCDLDMWSVGSDDLRVGGDIVSYRLGKQSQKSLGIDYNGVLSGQHWLAHHLCGTGDHKKASASLYLIQEICILSGLVRYVNIFLVWI